MVFIFINLIMEIKEVKGKGFQTDSYKCSKCGYKITIKEAYDLGIIK